MAQTQRDPGNGSKRPGLWQRWHQRVGWMVGIVAPLITPFLPIFASVPQGAVRAFDLAGPVAGWLGFGTGYYLWSRTTIPRIAVWVATIAAGAGAIYFRGKYRELLWAIPTPTIAEEWLMLVLYALSYFGVFFVVAFVYWSGGRFLLEKLFRV